jgi:hypothetical protein
MTKTTTTVTKEQPVNMKEKNAQHTFRVTIRDTAHFYKIVNWLNTNVGKGQDKWTMEGRVLKTLKQGKSVSPKVYIFVDSFEESSSLYLSLL